MIFTATQEQLPVINQNKGGKIAYRRMSMLAKPMSESYTLRELGDELSIRSQEHVTYEPISDQVNHALETNAERFA